MFDRNVPEESLESWALTSSTAQGSVFEASNRFFTSKREAPDMEPVPISPSINPHGILETLTKGEFIHGEEKMKSTITEYMRILRGAAKGTNAHTTQTQITILMRK